MSGFLPWAIETAGDCFTNEPDPADRTPILGERCDLSVGGLGGASGDVGQLALSEDPSAACEAGNGSAATYETNIINGDLTTCEIGDSVTSNTGVNVGKTKSALEARLATEGACGGNAVPIFGTVQAAPTPSTCTRRSRTCRPRTWAAWAMSTTSSKSGSRPRLRPERPGDRLEQYNCNPDPAGIIETSPRNVSVVIVSDIAVDDGSGCSAVSVGASPHCYLVLGFARMYLEGCTTSAGFSAMYDQSGGRHFTIHARFVKAVGNNNAGLGVSQFGDIQTVLVE